MDRFSQLCREKIGEYVYALVDPRVSGPILERIFYVGKGTRDRCHDHARLELKTEELGDKQLKLSTIREIRRATDAPPPVFIVAHSLSRDEALRLEAIMIATLGIRTLRNAVRGQGDRDVWLPADEIDARYASPVQRRQIEGTVLFVSLNGGPELPPYPEIKDDERRLAVRTLSWWPVASKKAARVDLVVGVYRGLTRCAFEIDKDGQGRSVFAVRPASKPRSPSRVEFRGVPLPLWPHLLRRVVDDAGKSLTVFPPRGCSAASFEGPVRSAQLRPPSSQRRLRRQAPRRT